MSYFTALNISVSLLLSSAIVWGQAPTPPPPSPPDDRIVIDLFPKGQERAGGTPVRLTFSGLVYDRLPFVTGSSKEYMSYGPAEKFLMKVVSTYQDGSLDDVLKLWTPGSREEIRKIASDTTLFEGNRNFFRGIERSEFVSRIDYGNYMIFIIRHWRGSNSDFFKDYPVRKTADGYALTNELQDDPVYTYVSTAYVRNLKQSVMGAPKTAETR